MIAAHMNQLETRLPRIGVIRKGAEKGERGPGRDLDHFRLDRAEQSVADAWRAVLGDEPRSISGILPYADPAECLSIWDELWQGKRLMWRGDGERLHVQLQGNTYVRYAPGAGPQQPQAAGEDVGNLKVARISRLRLLLPQLRIAGIFEIASSSRIDADELWANLMWIRQTVQTLQGAPVTVFRAARQFNVARPDGKTMPVTKHMLHLTLDGRYIDSLLPVGGGLLPAPPVVPTLPSGLADDAEDGLFDEDEPPAVVAQPVKHPAATQPVIVQQAQTAGPLPDDELMIREATPREFFAVAAMGLGVDEAHVKARMRQLGYSTIHGKPEERIGQYRKVKAAIQADAGTTFVVEQDDLFGEKAQPALVPVEATSNGAYAE